MTRRRRVVVVTSLVLASVLLALVAGELLARYLAAFELVDGRLVFTVGEERGEVTSVETYTEVPVWRRPHPDRPPPAVDFDGFRILVLGDSVLEPARLPQAEGIAMRLEGLLNQRLEGGPFEVVNLAEGGWATIQEEAVLMREGLPLAPDLVLVGVTPNDTQQHVLRDGNIVMIDYVNAEEARGGDWGRILLRHSYLANQLWLSKELREYKWTPPEPSEVTGRVLDPLQRMAEATAAGGGRFAVLCLPWIPEDRFRGKADSDYCGVDGLRAWARGAGVPLFDPVPALAAVPISEIRMDHIHLTARGHEILVTPLFEWLLSEGLLPTGGLRPQR